MSLMSEAELSNANGEGLFALEETVGANNITFNKLSLNADIELNANINSLKLGCGGVNGSSNCDIDIDRFSLTGESGGPNSDAVLKNPYYEFAIKNATSKANRELVGVRFGAKSMVGQLAMGDNLNSMSKNNAGIDAPNGLNSFSGYMQVSSATGQGKTKVGYMTDPLWGNIQIAEMPWLATIPLRSDNKVFVIPSVTTTFKTSPMDVSGNRLSGVTLKAVSDVPNIPLNAVGPRTVWTDGGWIYGLGFLPIPFPRLTINSTYYSGEVAGIQANITINQKLGHIHKIPLTGSPTTLSVQKEAVLWPNAPVNLGGQAIAAQRGWWMAFDQPINLGDISATNEIDISSTFPTIAKSLSEHLVAHPIQIPLGNVLSGIFGGDIYAQIGVRDLREFATPSNPVNQVSLLLESQKLVNQNIVSNCFNAKPFC